MELVGWSLWKTKWDIAMRVCVRGVYCRKTKMHHAHGQQSEIIKLRRRGGIHEEVGNSGLQPG